MPLPVTPGMANSGLRMGTLFPFDPYQRTASNEVNDQPMARTDWTFALSIVATLALAVSAISILLFAM